MEKQLNGKYLISFPEVPEFKERLSEDSNLSNVMNESRQAFLLYLDSLDLYKNSNKEKHIINIDTIITYTPKGKA